jgi:hypothetical protein
VSAYQHGVSGRLVGRELGDEPAIAECEHVTVYDEHAAVTATSRYHLSFATACVGVATK